MKRILNYLRNGIAGKVMAHTKRPKSKRQRPVITKDPLDDPGHIEKLRQISNAAYLSLRRDVPDERELAFVIAIIAGTYLMNVSDDPEFHDQVMDVIITTLVNHPPLEAAVNFTFPGGNGNDGKIH